MSVRMLPESELPPGPRRDLAIALHGLYNAAGRPATRKISNWIRDNDELAGTLSHDAVSSTLRGLTVPRWENLESLVHVLAAAQVVGPKDVESAKEQIYNLWLSANDSLPKLPSVAKPAAQPAPNTQAPAETTASHSAVDDDLLAARRWYEQCITTGDVDAMLKLGTLLGYRLDPPDLAGARDCYERAVATGSYDAMVKLGDLLVDEMDPPARDVAAIWWEKAAEAGDAAAMVRLGNLLSTAEPPNMVAAKELWEKAALAGEPAAMNNMGVFHLNQQPPDLVGARWWYQKAAFAGHPAGMFNLWRLLKLERLLNALDRTPEPGVMDRFFDFLKGRRMRGRQDNEAWNWIEKAAKAGHPDAMTDFGRLLCTVRPPRVSAATLWFEKATATGHAAAMVELGRLFHNQGDFNEAKRWYDKAMETGHDPALQQLAHLLANHPNLPGAREGLEQAAEAGYIVAMRALAGHLWFYSPTDRDAAARWHRRYLETGDYAFEKLLNRIQWWMYRHL